MLSDFVVSTLANGGWDRRIRLFRVAGEIDIAVVLTRRLLVIVDTGPSPSSAQAVIEALQSESNTRLPLVINTHADYDHAWGNAAFSAGGDMPSQIIATVAAGERLRSQTERDYLALRRRENPRFAQVQLIPPTIEIADRCRIDGGDFSLELLPTPGHTPDHLSVWIPDLRTVLAGDAAEFPFPYCGEDTDVTQLVSSLCTLRALAPEVVIPCHGGPGTVALLDRNIAYFVRLDEVARQQSPALSFEASSEAVLGVYDYPAALRDQGTTAGAVPDCYRQWHQRAVHAVVKRTRNGLPPLAGTSNRI